MPPSGFGDSTELATPYQSIGARGVRTLASKFLLSLFPPNSSFYRYAIDDATLRDLTQQEGMRGEVEAALSAREKAVLLEMEAAVFRPAAFQVFQQLLVSGNVLIHIPDEGPAKIFRLDQYVVRRSASGAVREIVVEEGSTPTSSRKQLRTPSKRTASSSGQIKS